MRLSTPPRLTLACVCCGSLGDNGFDASAKEQIRAAWKGEPDELRILE